MRFGKGRGVGPTPPRDEAEAVLHQRLLDGQVEERLEEARRVDDRRVVPELLFRKAAARRPRSQGTRERRRRKCRRPSAIGVLEAGSSGDASIVAGPWPPALCPLRDAGSGVSRRRYRRARSCSQRRSRSSSCTSTTSPGSDVGVGSTPRATAYLAGLRGAGGRRSRRPASGLPRRLRAAARAGGGSGSSLGLFLAWVGAGGRRTAVIRVRRRTRRRTHGGERAEVRRSTLLRRAGAARCSIRRARRPRARRSGALVACGRARCDRPSAPRSSSALGILLKHGDRRSGRQASFLGVGGLRRAGRSAVLLVGLVTRSRCRGCGLGAAARDDRRGRRRRPRRDHSPVRSRRCSGCATAARRARVRCSSRGTGRVAAPAGRRRLRPRRSWRLVGADRDPRQRPRARSRASSAPLPAGKHSQPTKIQTYCAPDACWRGSASRSGRVIRCSAPAGSRSARSPRTFVPQYMAAARRRFSERVAELDVPVRRRRTVGTACRTRGSRRARTWA